MEDMEDVILSVIDKFIAVILGNDRNGSAPTVQYTEIGCDGLTINHIMNFLATYPIKFSGLAIDLIDEQNFNLKSYENNKELIESNLLSFILLDKNNPEKGYDRIAYEFINNPKANHIILIDGNHSYEKVRQDYENVLKWIEQSKKKIHLIMFHDSGKEEQGINESQTNGIEVRKFLSDFDLHNDVLDIQNIKGRSLFVKMIIKDDNN